MFHRCDDSTLTLWSLCYPCTFKRNFSLGKNNNAIFFSILNIPQTIATSIEKKLYQLHARFKLKLLTTIFSAYIKILLWSISIYVYSFDFSCSFFLYILFLFRMYITFFASLVIFVIFLESGNMYFLLTLNCHWMI